MATIDKRRRDKIVAQSLLEIDFDRRYKRGKLPNWQTNEKLYYIDKTLLDGQDRSNVFLPKMAGFVETLKSKLTTHPRIKFRRGEEGDLKKERLMNALKDQDSRPQLGNWDYKDSLGKDQAIMYGRSIFEVYASSNGGYQSHMDMIDVADFLIDPSAGGMDLEEADHLGHNGVWLSEWQLREGVKNGTYIKEEVMAILGGQEIPNEEMMQSGDGNVRDEETVNKENRYAILQLPTDKVMAIGKFKFFKWYTTYMGERYSLLLSEQRQRAIRVDKLVDKFKSGLWPYWSWAVYPKKFEFWTLSPADLVREIFMAQIVTVNQTLDNNEAINRPMIAYDVDAILNPSMLNFRRDGKIPVKGGIDINRAVQRFAPIPLTTSLQLYNLLEGIQQTESGVTAAAKGNAGEDKVAIYEGNVQQVADRLSVINDSFANGFARHGLLYYNGVKEHMNTKTAIRMVGPSGIEFKEIIKEDVIPVKNDFDILVEASDTEASADSVKNKNKLVFLTNNGQNPKINLRKALEIEAMLVGFDPDTVKELLDVSEDSDMELMSEASRDIQRLMLEDVITQPNERANSAYMQKLVDYLRDEGENMNDTQKRLMIDYIEEIKPIVIKNMAAKAVGQQVAGGEIPGMSMSPDNSIPPSPEGSMGAMGETAVTGPTQPPQMLPEGVTKMPYSARPVRKQRY